MISTTLFILPSVEAQKSTIQMPKETEHEWFTLHSTSHMNRVGHESHVPAFPMRNILTIAQGELFTQLAGGHYFLFPILTNEQRRCEQALQDFALNMWDSLHLSRVNLLQFPDNQLTQGQLLAPVVNNISSSATTFTNTRSINRRLQPTNDPTVKKALLHLLYPYCSMKISSPEAAHLLRLFRHKSSQ